jgi:DNA helicase II / ATP-dependent DNA helicase PcrA
VFFAKVRRGVLMADHEQIIEKEQVRVNKVIDSIEKQMEKLKSKTGNLKKDIVSLRKSFWDDVTVNIDDPDDVIETHASIKQQAELLGERERSHGQFHKQYKNLQRLKSSPYFGRIDFVEEGEKKAEQIYIGLFSLMDEDGENFLIYDWRAPIARMYYDYAPGPAQYETMDSIIKGEIELKRQYMIRNGRIKGMFDTTITIGDEILQAVLSGQADNHMKNIVATIQKEQNAIIRNNKKKYLVVHGAAGSGKTSAAMQRVAYLLYRYRETLKAENILLFSPNQMFNSYVSTVLPELGEDNMEQSTFYQYLQQRLNIDIENPYTQIEYVLGAKQDQAYDIRKKSIQFKASLAYKKIIDHYVKDLLTTGMLFKNIRFRGELLISKKEIYDYFYSLKQISSIPNRISLVKEWLLDKLKVVEKNERSKEWVEEERELLNKDDYLKIYRKLQKQKRFTEDTFDDFAREEQLLAGWVVKRRLKPLRDKIANLVFIDIIGLYRKFFSWAQLKLVDLKLPDEWMEIKKLTLARLATGELLFEDATPFLYLKDKIEGKHTYNSIRHLFIDEAQDYSPFQLSYLKEIFPNSRMTILGDMNQSIFTHSIHNEHAFAKSENLFPEEELERIVLTKSYRSTKQIVEFTEEMLTANHKIEPFNREGEVPTLSIVPNKSKLHENIIKKVKDLQNKGFETVAIICKTAMESHEAYEMLKEELHLRLIRKETSSFEKGVLIIPSYLAKGIEFDAVIIYNCANDVYDHEDERTLFYTACTRAMHELHLYSVGEPNDFVKSVGKSKYRKFE